MSLDSQELLRKVLHIGVGLLAFTLVFLGPLLTSVLLGALVLLNLTVLPRFGARWLWRPHEALLSAGIVAYPAVLLCLHLMFWHRLEIVATVWGMLALGDGMASIAGRSLGGPALSWNSRKTWVGSLAYWGFGTLGAAAVLGFTLSRLGQSLAMGELLVIASITALVAAWVESQPQKLDDNITVPPIAALILVGLLESSGWQTRTDPQSLLMGAGLGLLASVSLGTLAFRLGTIDVSGMLTGTVLGTVIFAFLGWRGFVVLGCFVAIGSAVSRLGSEAKRKAGLAAESGGRRSARHAVANVGLAAAVAVLATTTPHELFLLPAFVAAFAGALSDTVSSEVGPLAAGPVFLVTTLEKVPAGTDGGVSVLGTASGAFVSVATAGLGWSLGFYPIEAIIWVALAGLGGNLADSLAGALLERRGLLDNEGINFLSTVVAALLAMGFMGLR